MAYIYVWLFILFFPIQNFIKDTKLFVGYLITIKSSTSANILKTIDRRFAQQINLKSALTIDFHDPLFMRIIYDYLFYQNLNDLYEAL